MIVPMLYGNLTNLDNGWGVRMWDLLKKTDIEQAKQELKLRRAEILTRQAEENRNLDATWSELEILNELIDIFLQKHAKPAIVLEAPAPAPISTQKIADKMPPEARHHHHRDQRQPQPEPRDKHQTVFATFMRAAARV